MRLDQDYQVPSNRLLAALPIQEYQRLIPHLELVSLPLNTVLYEAGEPIQYVYFPNRAMISLVAITLKGQMVEIGLIGNEGVVGLPVFLGGRTSIGRVFVQVEDSSMRMKADVLKAEFARGGPLQSLLLLYTQAFLTQASQGAVCNCLHNLRQRLARWLLSVQDRMRSDELLLTQEFISEMLGSRRSSVSEAAVSLQKAGIIRYRRGRISILNRAALEAIACECYEVIKTEYHRLLGQGAE